MAITLNLAGELYKFGLNSEDWLIEKDRAHNQTGQHYILINRLDPDFQMRGSVAGHPGEAPHWKDLSIASI